MVCLPEVLKKDIAEFDEWFQRPFELIFCILGIKKNDSEEVLK
jgi:hypothetical protein